MGYDILNGLNLSAQLVQQGPLITPAPVDENFTNSTLKRYISVQSSEQSRPIYEDFSCFFGSSLDASNGKNIRCRPATETDKNVGPIQWAQFWKLATCNWNWTPH